MRIDIASKPPQGWDDYVRGHAVSSAYHGSQAVGIGATAFDLDTFYLSAIDAQEKTIGVLPLVEQSSFVFGRFISSLPFVTYGGVLADNDEAARALMSAAAELASERKARHVEFRNRDSGHGFDFPERTDKVSMLLELAGDEEAVSSSLKSKLRSQIRRAERENPEVVWGRRELVAEFYSLFAPSMHALGTPVYPRRFFDVVVDAIDTAKVLVIRVAGKAEAAAVVVSHGASVEVPWAVATLWGKRNAINMRLYWEMIRSAANNGHSHFDFGRSSVDSGTYRFKAQWGAKPHALHWHYWLSDGGDVPTLNHSNPKYRAAIRAWQAMPLWCANLIGPRISRNLP